MPWEEITEDEWRDAGLPEMDLTTGPETGVGVPQEALDMQREGFTKEDWARLGIEGGLGILAVAASRGTVSPAIASRIPQAIPILSKAAPAISRMIPAAVGEATGSLVSETFDPSESPVARAAKTGAVAAVGEGVIGPAIGKLAEGAGHLGRLVEGGKEYVQEALGAGLSPSVGRASKNRLFDIVEAIGESSFLGGGKIAKNVDNVKDFYEGLIKSFVDTFRGAASKEAIEDLARESIEKSADAWKATGKSLYNEMDEAVATLPSRKVKKVVGKEIQTVGEIPRGGVDIEPLLKRIEEAKKRGLDPSAANRISRLVKNRVAEFGFENKIPFALAHEIRSEFLGIGRQSQALISTKAPALGKELAGVLDDAMEKAAKEAGGDIYDLWRKADAFWKEGADVYNSSIIKALTKREPQSVFRALQSADPRVIRRVRKTINDEKLWENIQGEFLFDLLEKSAGETEELVAKKLANRLRSIKDPVMNEMFSPEQIQRLRTLVRSNIIAQGDIGQGIPGRIFIQLKQAGAWGQAGALVIGHSAGMSKMGIAAIIVGPDLAARLFQNKAFIKWATLGGKFKPGTKQAINAVSQMFAIAIAEGAGTLDASEYDWRSTQRPKSLRPATFYGPTVSEQ